MREIKSASERNSEFVSAATRHYRVLQARSMRIREDIRIARRYASTCLTIEPRLIENRVFRWGRCRSQRRARLPQHVL
jgi:hypothetical protein